MKRCEVAGCGREASNLAVFEAKVAPGIFPRWPWQWQCREHAAKVWADVVFKEGRPSGVRSVLSRVDMDLFERVYAELKKRNPELWEALEKREEGVMLSLGPSKLTELEAEELRQAAVDEGRTVRQQRADVEVISAEQAAREMRGN